MDFTFSEREEMLRKSVREFSKNEITPKMEAMEDTGNRMPGAKEVVRMIARVGKQAPDFEASAYADGGFKNVKLSDYKGKWVVLCFYPGDFTFV